MSHSKYTKRGYSLYIENWNRSAKKYINICGIWGHKGYSPGVAKIVQGYRISITDTSSVKNWN